jgi:hypothetical protein
MTSSPNEYDLEGLKNALGTKKEEPKASDEYDITGLKSALEKKTEEKTIQPKSAKEDLTEQFSNKILSSVKSFEMGVGSTISESTGALQQMLGKAVSLLHPEMGGAIEKNARENIQKAQDINAQFAEANPIANISGKVLGAVINPENKLIPFGGASTSLTGGAIKGGLQGATGNVLMQPVMDEDAPFLSEKVKQAVEGGAFGAVGGTLFQGISGVLGNQISNLKTALKGKSDPQQIDQAVTQMLVNSGIDPKKAPSFFNSLKEQATEAVETGDIKHFVEYAIRHMDAESLPVKVPMLRGQLTRDPYQYTMEKELAKIEGVGKPIGDVLVNQNRALLDNLNKFGAQGAQNINESGAFLKKTLENIYSVEKQKVRDAYTAFKNSTGRNLDVPLQGVAQDYAQVLRDFGDKVPSGVKNNFEALGLMSGKQMKVTTIEDAERLIKVINSHYDVKNVAESKALDQLRTSVNNAIKNAGANEIGEAGQLAMAARKAASNRFDTIDSIPALKDVIRGKEPDKFVMNHILQGNVNEIDAMVKYLGQNSPQSLAQLRNDVIGKIKSSVTNKISEGNATFSQSQLKNYLTDQTGARLEKFLSPEQWNGLNKLNRVAENALHDPVASAVNKSNTASQAINMVKGMVKGGAINEVLSNLVNLKVPLLGTGAKMLAEANQRMRADELINQAINPSVRVPKGTPINQLNVGVPSAVLGRESINQRNREFEQENK